MEAESYWKTRTIAEAQSQGYSHCSRHLFGLWQDHRYSLAVAPSPTSDHYRNLHRERAAEVPEMRQHRTHHRRAVSRQYTGLREQARLTLKGTGKPPMLAALLFTKCLPMSLTLRRG